MITDTVTVRRSPQRLTPDLSRVISRLFVPGQQDFDHQESRATAVLDRILALDEADVESTVSSLVARFEGRHRNLRETWRHHADLLTPRLDQRAVLSEARLALIGATFTSEFAIEGAALCNPSAVPHPDQTGLPSGSLRVLVSVRAIGEGHLSSIGFRTGVIDGDGNTHLDTASALATVGRTEDAPLNGAVFRGELDRLQSMGENADYVLGALGEQFTAAQLAAQLSRLENQLSTRSHGGETIALIRQIAARTYGVRFDPEIPMSERVLWPAMAAEHHGLEDARFVRFTDEGGGVVYYATYTAYDGVDISQQLLETTDFVRFTSSPIVGRAAANKGLALFPRRIAGRYAALSRSDRETNAVAFSENLRQWPQALPCQVPTRSWEVLQLGNCGSPMETEDGWLVLTHGVGPMRTYSIGAILLDLEDPTKIIGQLQKPLLQPAPDEQNGYVPNVVYSCGAMLHAGTLVLPFGIGDASIGVATVPLAELLAAMV